MEIFMYRIIFKVSQIWKKWVKKIKSYKVFMTKEMLRPNEYNYGLVRTINLKKVLSVPCPFSLHTENNKTMQLLVYSCVKDVIVESSVLASVRPSHLDLVPRTSKAATFPPERAGHLPCWPRLRRAISCSDPEHSQWKHAPPGTVAARFQHRWEELWKVSPEAPLCHGSSYLVYTKKGGRRCLWYRKAGVENGVCFSWHIKGRRLFSKQRKHVPEQRQSVSFRGSPLPVCIAPTTLTVGRQTCWMEQAK